MNWASDIAMHRSRLRLPRQSQKAMAGEKGQTERAASCPAGYRHLRVSNTAGLIIQVAAQVAEQKIFIVRLVIGYLDARIRVEVI